jgi:uncharacterized protein (DUF2237 family)
MSHAAGSIGRPNLCDTSREDIGSHKVCALGAWPTVQ